MRSTLLGLASVAAVALTTAVAPQPAMAQVNAPILVRTDASIQAKLKELIAKSKTSPDGSSNVTLDQYPNHYTMAIARTKDGGAEVHADLSDIFVVEEGEGNILTGGTVVNPKTISPGETRGTKLTGATTAHPVHKGDIIHIAPGVPHQTMVPHGLFTYFVIKVHK